MGSLSSRSLGTAPFSFFFSRFQAHFETWYPWNVCVCVCLSICVRVGRKKAEWWVESNTPGNDCCSRGSWTIFLCLLELWFVNKQMCRLAYEIVRHEKREKTKNANRYASITFSLSLSLVFSSSPLRRCCFFSYVDYTKDIYSKSTCCIVILLFRAVCFLLLTNTSARCFVFLSPSLSLCLCLSLTHSFVQCYRKAIAF